jgi:hypothetical protein
VGDEFVGPDASGDAGDYGSLCFWMVVLGQFVFVCDEGHHVSELWSCLPDDVDVLFCLFEFGIAVDSSDAGLSYPFAVDVVGFDLALERVIIGQLEASDFGGVGVFEEDGLAVAAVLEISLAIVQHTTSYAKQSHSARSSPARFPSLKHHNIMRIRGRTLLDATIFFQEVASNTGSCDTTPNDNYISRRRQASR